jgi:hypothetical protein
VIIVSVLVTRIATIALVHTGLSREAAQFQARSAFTGVGFTTTESERVVKHPVRRRIVLLLMLFGNAGIVTAIASLILTFLPREESIELGLKLAYLLTGVLFIWLVVRSRWFHKSLFTLVSKALEKYSVLEIRDYSSLLQLGGDYRVSEYYVDEGSKLINKSLQELQLTSSGILILAITRKDSGFIGSPHGANKIFEGDTIIIYGKLEDVDKIKEL